MKENEEGTQSCTELDPPLPVDQEMDETQRILELTNTVQLALKQNLSKDAN